VFIRRGLFPGFCTAIVLVGLGRWVDGANRAGANPEEKEKATRDVRKDALPLGAIARLGKWQDSMYDTSAVSIAFLPDFRTVVTTAPKKKIVLWDTRTAKSIRYFDGHLFLALAPDGKTMATRSNWKDKSIRLLDLTGEKQIGEISAPLGLSGRGCCFSPDSRYLAVSGGHDGSALRLFEVSTRKLVREFAFREIISVMAFSPNGKYLATSKNIEKPGTVKLWDVATGNEIRVFEGDHRFEPMALSFSPDAKLLVGADAGIRAWDVDTGKLRWEIYRGGPKIGNLSMDFASSVAFSPNGKTIAIGTSRAGAGPIREGTRSSIYLFEAATGRKRAEFEGGATVLSVAFSPCGLMLGSEGYDAAPLIWDVTQQILAAKKPPPAFSANDLDGCWNDLAGGGAFKTGWVDMRAQDAAKAWQAICALTIRPEQSVPFLKKRLPAKPKLEPKQEARLQDELENGDVATRERAVKKLAEIGPPALPFLHKLGRSGINADAKRRIAKLLGEPGKAGLLTEEARCRYAIEVLEYVGTPQAKEVLLAQAEGEPGSPVTQDAKSALSRLGKLPPSPP
jgi:hypothetical protein